MRGFRYDMQAGRVVFEVGSVAMVRLEVEQLAMQRVAVLCTPGRAALAETIVHDLGERCAGTYTRAEEHVPRSVVGDALRAVAAWRADGLVAAGGGATVGLAKAIALETGLPIVAVPTTYSGSEMTPVWGITDNGKKITGKNFVVKPKTVIYDPTLTISLPARVSATSGMNAIAHCVEGLYAENADPVTSLLAEEGIRALAQSLPLVVTEPENIGSRSRALYGAWLAGTVLATVGMALHHKLCHVLGGTYHLPHADTHTVVLPHVARYNAGAAPGAMKAVGRALGTSAEDAPGALFDLAQSMGAPTSLVQVGMAREQLDEAAKLVVQNPYYNPRPIENGAIRRLLQAAYDGVRP